MPITTRRTRFSWFYMVLEGDSRGAGSQGSPLEVCIASLFPDWADECAVVHSGVLEFDVRPTALR